MDEDTYVLIFRKQQQLIRHALWKILEETGGPSEDPAKQRAQQERFIAAVKEKPKYQKMAMEMYGVKLQPGEQRNAEMVM